MKLKNILLTTVILATSMAMTKEKVILDTDMVELFDDGLAMIMLANSDQVDLLGVTTVSGNTWSREGTAYGIRQLEAIERMDIPVAEGLRYPFRASRHEGIQLEQQIFGIGPSKFLGSLGYDERSKGEPKSWVDFYEATYQEVPTFTPVKEDAVDFIIDAIYKNPNEITIAAIGPCTNIAMAIRKDPDIVPLIKRVIYMGGAFEVRGNTTPAAEFNWWFDPEAAKMCVRAPFKEQIVVGLDVTDKVFVTKDRYEQMKQLPNLYPKLKELFLNSRYEKRFENPEATSFVWDLLVSAIIIDPSIITEEKTQWIDVNTEYTQDYGRSLAYDIQGPLGTEKARVIHTIDEEKFWNLMYQLIQKQ